jgi:glyoxylase-like metal-dependent hydrolase (beta-lactamase superfamily II)
MDELAPGLFRLTTGGAAAVHLVMADLPTLVDAGAPGRGPALERELRAAGIHPERLVLTHGDPDHVGGSDHLRAAFGLETWAPIVEGPLVDRTGWDALPPLRRILMRLFFRGSPPPTVDRWFDTGVDLGGLIPVPTPGHTPGHVVYEWEGWLLAGDAFVSGRQFRESPRVFTIDRAGARRSIERLWARQPHGASSSHGSPAIAATERLEALVKTWR